LPFGNGQRFGGGASGLKEKLIGGWQWNGIVTAQGGFPITPLIGSNNSGTGQSLRRPQLESEFSWQPDFGQPEAVAQSASVLHADSGYIRERARGSLRGPGLPADSIGAEAAVLIADGSAGGLGRQCYAAPGCRAAERPI
jgi:hypothetical protein